MKIKIVLQYAVMLGFCMMTVTMCLPKPPCRQNNGINVFGAPTIKHWLLCYRQLMVGTSRATLTALVLDPYRSGLLHYIVHSKPIYINKKNNYYE